MKKIEKDKIIRGRLKKAKESPIKAYKEFAVGECGFFYFLKYEILTTVLGPLPGGLGFFLRKKLYKSLFREVGRGLIIGGSVVLRHPQNIRIGNNVVIDDYSLVDARGDKEKGVTLEDDVVINRNCMLQAKTGHIKLGSRTSVGSYSNITSLEGVEFGEAVLTGGGCYFSAGSYSFEDAEAAIMDQDTISKGPITVGSNCYFGAGSMVVGGIEIGEGAVVGAGAVVIKKVPRGAVVAGVPAAILKTRVGFEG